MDKYYKINVEETRATKITADAGNLVKQEGIEGYAMMWLNLTNNQKSNKQDLLKISNGYDNEIYVICNSKESNVKATEDYLKRLGLEIQSKEQCVVVMPEEVFNDDDLDVELIDW